MAPCQAYCEPSPNRSSTFDEKKDEPFLLSLLPVRPPSCSGCSSVLLQDSVNPVSGDTEDSLGGAGEVPDAAVP